MTDICTFADIHPQHLDAVGGKGLSLGLMARAGLPVPGGFCVTCSAYRGCRGTSLARNAVLVESIHQAYRALGGGLVAVRSSATAEDGATASFAGQQETYLGINGEDAVCDAVARCWASLDSERAIAYRRKQGIGDDGLAMAVVVQRLVPAEVAGVLFTRDPLDPDGQRMLVEASWGLGEAVVSGRVSPDRFHVDHDTGLLLERHLGTKAEEVTAKGIQPVAVERQNQFCLDQAQLKQLAELGRQVEAFYGGPRDIEWAWAEGKFWLLQARPITAAGAADREKVRREEVSALTARADPSGTVWSRYNLAEILPEPTPMTWAIVRRFMSLSGGFGLMYRDLGYDPDPRLGDEGVYDLICGRPYCNLSREPRLLDRTLPFEYSFAVLKADPTKALYPTPVINVARLPWHFWALLPLYVPFLLFRQMSKAIKSRQLTATFAERFRRAIAPPFLAQVKSQREQDLTALDDEALLNKLEYWTKTTLIDFARESLKPTALAMQLMGTLESRLTKGLGAEQAKSAVRALVMGAKPEAASDLAGAVRLLSSGQLNLTEFLQTFGHRGSQEMELSRPRWSEDSSELRGMSAMPEVPSNRPTPAQVWERVATAAKLNASQRDTVKAELATLHDYLGLRESAKHYLMSGYALIRAILIELDRRYRLNGGVFFLHPDELPRLIKGEDLSARIAERKTRRILALSLEVPPVIFSDDLAAIGRAAALTREGTLQGVALSAGMVEAPALVLERPQVDELPAEGYILVCPSTDPAWIPLFVRARGLVMETGGVLSHGAIVAREFGLPAVAGIAGVTRHVKTGQRLLVDGVRGTVTPLS